MYFENKTAWVTGASSGIGEALALALLERGARVIASGRRPEPLAALAARAPERVLVLPFETTDYDALPAIVEKVPNVRYLVVGTGAFESELRVLADALGLSGHVTLADAEQWLTAWDRRIRPSSFYLMGGEPFAERQVRTAPITVLEQSE